MLLRLSLLCIFYQRKKDLSFTKLNVFSNEWSSLSTYSKSWNSVLTSLKSTKCFESSLWAFVPYIVGLTLQLPVVQIELTRKSNSIVLKSVPYKFEISLISFSHLLFKWVKKHFKTNIVMFTNKESCLTFYENYVKSRSNNEKHCWFEIHV